MTFLILPLPTIIIDITIASRECTAPKAGGDDREPCGLCKGENNQHETCNDVSASTILQRMIMDCFSTFVRSGASGNLGHRARAAAGRGRGRGRGAATPQTSNKPLTGQRQHFFAEKIEEKVGCGVDNNLKSEWIQLV